MSTKNLIPFFFGDISYVNPIHICKDNPLGRCLGLLDILLIFTVCAFEIMTIKLNPSLLSSFGEYKLGLFIKDTTSLKLALN